VAQEISRGLPYIVTSGSARDVNASAKALSSLCSGIEKRDLMDIYCLKHGKKIVDLSIRTHVPTTGERRINQAFLQSLSRGSFELIIAIPHGEIERRDVIKVFKKHMKVFPYNIF
jgi:hypothetical protein